MSLTGKLLLNEDISLDNLKEANNKEYNYKEDKQIKEQNKTIFLNKLKKGLATGLTGLILYASGLGIFGCSPSQILPNYNITSPQLIQTEEDLKEVYDTIKPDLDYLIGQHGYDLAMRLSEETLFRDRINIKPTESLTYFVDYNSLRQFGYSENDIYKVKEKENWIIYEVIPKGIPYPELYPKLTENRNEADIIVKFTYLGDPNLEGGGGRANYDLVGNVVVGGKIYILEECLRNFPPGFYVTLVEEEMQILIGQRDYTGNAPVIMVASDHIGFQENSREVFEYLSKIGLSDTDIHLERIAYKLPLAFIMTTGIV